MTTPSPEQAEREAAVFSVTDCDHGGQNFEVYEQGRGAVGHFDTRAQAERVLDALARAAGRAEGEDWGRLEAAGLAGTLLQVRDETRERIEELEGALQGLFTYHGIPRDEDPARLIEPWATAARALLPSESSERHAGTS